MLCPEEWTLPNVVIKITIEIWNYSYNTEQKTQILKHNQTLWLSDQPKNN